MIGYAFLSGFGFGAFASVGYAVITRILPSATSYGKDIGLLNLASALPQAFAPAIAGAAVLAVGYRGVFVLGIVVLVLATVTVLPIKGIR